MLEIQYVYSKLSVTGHIQGESGVPVTSDDCVRKREHQIQSQNNTFFSLVPVLESSKVTKQING
jgi:hypothetical protein